VRSTDGVLILGAGLTGLSTAYHLGGGRVLEKEAEPGGLCRSYRVGGFTFDFTGHLLHLRDPYAIELVDRIAPGLFSEHQRRARIFSKGRLTGYPFQANLHGLPPRVVAECLEGLALAEETRPGKAPADDFRTWVLDTFGAGIARHFMLPYNRKLWCVPARQMTPDWVAGLVPVPRLEDALRGSREPEGVTMGYNARFRYPARGGIDTFVRRFLPHVPRLHLGRAVAEIDVLRRRAVCRDGSVHHFEELVSTIPLPELARCLKGVEPAVVRAAESLRYVSVWDLNLGIARENVSDAHWIYFPERRFPFYRVGFPSAFSAGAAPAGHSSAYVETAHLPGRGPGAEEMTERALAGLVAAGILAHADEAVVRDAAHIPCAYVIFDRRRRRLLPGIKAALRRHGIHLAGRYGAWEYTAMEDALLDGRRVAGAIRGEPG
jgi:protoporphyrinogen oxidase